MGWYIGLMSGTSMDGVDAVLARFEAPSSPATAIETASQPPSDRIPAAHFQHAVSISFSDVCLHKKKHINHTGTVEILRIAHPSQAVVVYYLQVVTHLLTEAQHRN